MIDWDINSGQVQSSFLYTMRAKRDSKNMSQVLNMMWRSYLLVVNYGIDWLVCINYPAIYFKELYFWYSRWVKMTHLLITETELNLVMAPDCYQDK